MIKDRMGILWLMQYIVELEPLVDLVLNNLQWLICHKTKPLVHFHIFNVYISLNEILSHTWTWNHITKSI